MPATKMEVVVEYLSPTRIPLPRTTGQRAGSSGAEEDVCSDIKGGDNDSTHIPSYASSASLSPNSPA